jgi:hypothetical protein
MTTFSHKTLAHDDPTAAKAERERVEQQAARDAEFAQEILLSKSASATTGVVTSDTMTEAADATSSLGTTISTTVSSLSKSNSAQK